MIRESLCGAGAGAITLGYDDLSQGKSEEYRGILVSICQSVGALGFRLVWLISWAALAATIPIGREYTVLLLDNRRLT